jgi:alkanesulfonate monooxygenase SsuD/methylene tetrahydromethanopterin reductase-like flavin-dependent oxidoreductase (luciferase family)
LWRGEPFSFLGTHYQVRNVQFLPRPLQSPRIPVWVAGRWPRRGPFLRAAHWDGVFPLGLARGSRVNPEDVRAIVSFIRNHKPDTSPYDVIATSGAEGQMDDEKVLRGFAEAGATWWLRDMRRWCNSIQELRNRIRTGPPRT